MLSEFVVGQQYTNDQIGISLRVENLGGIRPSVDASRKIRHIAIVTKLAGTGQNILENPYQDRIEGNILVFTGQGKAGDQTLTGRNKRITEQFDTPIPLYCFESCGRQLYVFRGLLELLRHYFEMQIDSDRKLRKVRENRISGRVSDASFPRRGNRFERICRQRQFLFFEYASSVPGKEMAALRR